MSPPTINKIQVYRYGIVFHIEGSTGEKYIVDYNIYKGWICDCPDHIYRHRFCKHMQACHDFIQETFDLTLPTNVWYDNPKADMVFNEVTV